MERGETIVKSMGRLGGVERTRGKKCALAYMEGYNAAWMEVKEMMAKEYLKMDTDVERISELLKLPIERIIEFKESLKNE